MLNQERNTTIGFAHLVNFDDTSTNIYRPSFWSDMYPGMPPVLLTLQSFAQQQQKENLSSWIIK